MKYLIIRSLPNASTVAGKPLSKSAVTEDVNWYKHSSSSSSLPPLPIVCHYSILVEIRPMYFHCKSNIVFLYWRHWEEWHRRDMQRNMYASVSVPVCQENVNKPYKPLSTSVALVNTQNITAIARTHHFLLHFFVKDWIQPINVVGESLFYYAALRYAWT